MKSQFHKKRRPMEGISDGLPINHEKVLKNLSWASDSEQLPNRDPMFHITDNFMRSFDAMGTMQQEMLNNSMKSEGPGLTDPAGKKLSESKENLDNIDDKDDEEEKDGKQALYRQTRMNEEFEENKYGKGRLMNRFTDMTFMRGKMSAAVLKGTGNMMLFSCLKRTIGQSQPYKLQQRKLFQGGSRQWKPMNVKASDASATTLVRNEVFADSAIGLVFNVTKDARRTMEQMTELIANGGTGTETWERMMPFLNMDKEETLLEQYKQRLLELGDNPENEQERSTLNKAVTRVETMMAKKRELRNEFMFKLRAIGGQARKACEVFSDEEFQNILKSNLHLAQEYPEPPEGNPPPEGETPPPAVGGE